MILAVVSLTKEETDAARQYAVVAHVAVDELSTAVPVDRTRTVAVPVRRTR